MVRLGAALVLAGLLASCATPPTYLCVQQVTRQGQGFLLCAPVEIEKPTTPTPDPKPGILTGMEP